MQNNHKEQFSKLLRECLRMDALAASAYAKFAENCPDPKLRKDWRACSETEKQHVEFWKKALKKTAESGLCEIVENPTALRESLRKNYRKFKKDLEGAGDSSNPAETLLLAYELEFFMLDPDMMAMLRQFKSVDSSIAEDYDRHIGMFTRMLREYGADSSHLPLLGETLEKLYKKNIQLAEDSLLDPLTKIYNRRGFFNRIAPFLAMARRENSSVGIVIADIDDFKKVNDIHGHPKGDETIRAAANAIKENTRKSDICGRYGGEEFIVFLNLQKEISLDKLCRRINEASKQSFRDDCGIEATISLGATSGKLTSPDEQELSFLIDRADKNLLRAKKEGKNRWIVS